MVHLLRQINIIFCCLCFATEAMFLRELFLVSRLSHFFVLPFSLFLEFFNVAFHETGARYLCWGLNFEFRVIAGVFVSRVGWGQLGVTSRFKIGQTVHFYFFSRLNFLKNVISFSRCDRKRVECFMRRWVGPGPWGLNSCFVQNHEFGESSINIKYLLMRDFISLNDIQAHGSTNWIFIRWNHSAVFMIVYLLFLKYYRLTSKARASLIMPNSSWVKLLLPM